MNKNDHHVKKRNQSQGVAPVVVAALAGLLAGTSAQAMVERGSAGTVAGFFSGDAGTPVNLADAGKHDCKGMNACKNQGGCQSGDNGCKGKNSCKKKGGCSTNSG